MARQAVRSTAALRGQDFSGEAREWGQWGPKQKWCIYVNLCRFMKIFLEAVVIFWKKKALMSSQSCSKKRNLSAEVNAFNREEFWSQQAHMRENCSHACHLWAMSTSICGYGLRVKKDKPQVGSYGSIVCFHHRAIYRCFFCFVYIAFKSTPCCSKYPPETSKMQAQEWGIRNNHADAFDLFFFMVHCCWFIQLITYSTKHATIKMRNEL